MAVEALVPQTLAAARPAPAPANGLGRWLLIGTGLLVSAAAFRALRVDAGGLLVPLYVIPIVIGIPTVVAPNIVRLPTPLKVQLPLFLALYALSMLPYGSQFGDLVKMATSVFTVMAVTLMVRRQGDFAAATIALALSLLVMNVNGLRGGMMDYVGYQPLGELANKNAYSIYALPVVLVVGYHLLHFKTGWLTKLIFGALIVSTAFLLFSGANRSGWGGMLLIAGMLAIQARRGRAIAAVAVLSVASYGIWAALGDRTTFDYRVQQTADGYSSDTLRENMIETGFEIGLENPILGITPQQLPYEMARRLEAGMPLLDTHNFAAYIVGGSGFATFLALLALAFVSFKRPKGELTPEVKQAHDLVRMVLVLFAMRGMFSREVFFVGPFPIVFGLAWGLTLVAQADAAARSPGRALALKNASRR